MDDWLQALLRFAHYALLLGLFGAAAFRAFGMGRLVAAGAVPAPRVALAVGCALAALVSLALMAVSVAAMMGQPVRTLHWPMFEVMVASTSMGSAFLIRLAALLAAMVVLALPLGRWSSAGAFLLGVAVATLAWSGHAAAGEGTLGTLHRANDVAHLLASGIWIGAIGWFAYLVAAAHRRRDAAASVPLLAAMHRFAPLGAALVGIVAVSGIANAHLIFGLENSGGVLRTAYGAWLAAKVALVAAMLLFAGRNALLSRRIARAGANASVAAELLLPALRRSLAAELSLAVAVIGSVAVLGLMSPMH